MSESLRILVVCTYNRTRSVLIGALLEDALRRRGRNATITTAGFEEAGLPATADAVAALAGRGIDAGSHLGERLTDAMVERADLILAAERIHVARISGDRLDVFRRTFTVPELVGLVAASDARGTEPLAAWLAGLAPDRNAAGYLGGYVPEVADPTGLSPLAFASAVAEMARLSDVLAAAL